MIFAFDLAYSIDLARAEDALYAGPPGVPGVQRETFARSARTPQHFRINPPPLRVVRPCPSVEVGPARTEPTAECLLVDFGAASVTFALPFDEPLHELPALGERLYEHAGLHEAARAVARDLLAALGDAAVRPAFSDAVEDYAVYEIRESPEDAAAWVNAAAGQMAGLLRAERGRLSAQERDDALSCRVSYSPSDVAVIDWNAALAVGESPEDVRAVLEFANIELLELRHLDQRLDRALDEVQHLASPRARRPLLPIAIDARLRRIAELQTESALLFENVNNALKLLGDQYLARLYRRAGERLHLPAWDAAILRKLEVLESIYQKELDRAANLRIEILEWIIIALIAFEIILALFGRL